MSATLVFSAVITGAETVTTNSIGSENVIIQAQCLFGCRSSWKNAGTASELIQVPDVGEVEGETKKIILGTKLIRFNSLGYSYKIKMAIYPWIPQAEINVYVT